MRLAAVAVIILAAGCATPVVMLKHDKTGQLARCGGGTGGSTAGGLIGYTIEKDADAKCVADYEAQGFRRM